MMPITLRSKIPVTISSYFDKKKNSAFSMDAIAFHYGSDRIHLCRETILPLSNPILPDAPDTMGHSSDTVFKDDPVTHIRLDTPPNPAYYAQTAMLSAFTDLVSEDYALEVLLAHTRRDDEFLMPEQGPDLISDVVTVDYATLTALLSPASGVPTTSRFNCCAQKDTGSLQSSIHQGSFDQVVAAGAADESYV